MTEGGLEHYTGAKGPLSVARTFDPVELIASGTWRGSASDIELLRDR